MRDAFKALFEDRFFKLLSEKQKSNESKGRFDLYTKVKKQYNFEKYLLMSKNSLRRNITNIRISTHNFPVETLRRHKVKKEERYCKLCGTNEVGSEFHTLMLCKNNKVQEFRHTLDTSLCSFISQWEHLNSEDKFQYLILASDEGCNFYFSIFLDKLYKFQKQTTSQPTTC